MKRVLFALLAVSVSSGLTAATNGPHAKRIGEAAAVLRELRAVPDKSIPDDLWKKASCVAVIPSVKKGAFIVGGEYGKGVMSCRKGRDWSAPSFVLLEKGSIGFQIGGEVVDLVLLVMNDRGLEKLLADKVALGGEASVAGGPVGRDARAMTDLQLNAEILSYSRAHGVFAGVDLTGGVLKADKDDNRDLYGRAISAHDILVNRSVQAPPVAASLMTALEEAL